jgi:hypothetical protein
LKHIPDYGRLQQAASAMTLNTLLRHGKENGRDGITRQRG